MSQVVTKIIKTNTVVMPISSSSSSSSTATTAVPSCHLYTLAPCQRIENELRELGIDPVGSADSDVLLLNKIDGMRYEDDVGTQIFIDHINKNFGTDSRVSVLDVGSGFGGPSRLLCHNRGNTEVTALEYIFEISQLANSLTERCPTVRDRIQHISGDVTTLDQKLLEKSNDDDKTTTTFHAAQAVLSLLHVPDLELALSQVYNHLADDGILYIEDFWATASSDNALTEDQQGMLQERCGCPRMPLSNVAWCDLLSKVGFATVDFDDVTSSWQPYLSGRVGDYKKNMDRHVRVHGTEGANHMLEFYTTMDSLFSSGDLKGCRILARKNQAAMDNDDVPIQQAAID